MNLKHCGLCVAVYFAFFAVKKTLLQRSKKKYIVRHGTTKNDMSKTQITVDKMQFFSQLILLKTNRLMVDKTSKVSTVFRGFRNQKTGTRKHEACA